MTKQYLSIKSTLAQVIINQNLKTNLIGNLDDLNTTGDSDLVQAINEVLTNINNADSDITALTSQVLALPDSAQVLLIMDSSIQEIANNDSDIAALRVDVDSNSSDISFLQGDYRDSDQIVNLISIHGLDSSNFVSLVGNETIAGSKTFSSNLLVENSDPIIDAGAGLVTTGTPEVRLGNARSGSGAAQISLITDDTVYTDYGLRIVRAGGANATTQFIHRGTGLLSIEAEDSADIEFKNGSVTALYLDNTNKRVGINRNNPNVSLEVDGTDGIRLPRGDSGDRPSTEGTVRYNTVTNRGELFNGVDWASFAANMKITDVSGSKSKNVWYTNNTGRNMIVFFRTTSSLNATALIGLDSAPTTFNGPAVGNNLLTVSQVIGFVPPGSTWQASGVGSIDQLYEILI